MMKEIYRVILLATTLLLAQSALAANDSGGCGELSILIVNSTPDTCKLTSQHLIHGFLNNVSHIPSFIPPNTTSQALDLEQWPLGIALELSYQCGDVKHIAFSVRQDFSFFSAA